MAYRSSICTVSLGRAHAGHSLEHKFDMAQKYGFEGIELFYEDLVEFSTATFGNASQESQLAAAAIARELCQARDLTIICLQPFMHYEGLLDRQKHLEKLDEMRFWVDLVHALGTDLIMLPSSALPAEQISGDMSVIIEDMTKIADIGAAAEPPVKYAFEALCFGTKINKWEESWDVVRQVNRPNFGLCIDTFNLAGIYADPTCPSGRTPGCEEAVRKSLELLFGSVPARSIFLLQVADAELLSQPISPQHPFYDPAQTPRMTWSRNSRLFYGETNFGGYLPVLPVLETVVHQIGFTGWVSFEVFHRRLAEKDPAVPEEMARRASASFKKIMSDLDVDTRKTTTGHIQAPKPML